MTKLLIYIFRICLLTSMVATFVSCDANNIVDEKEEGRSAIIRLVVKTDESMNVGTRAVSETTIHDLHVLVYDSDNNLIGQKYQISNGKVEVIIHDVNSSTKKCTVYVIANSNKADLFKGHDIHNADYLKGMVYNISAWDELTKRTYLPMTGIKKDVNITANGQNLSMTVTRMVAKVALNIGVKTGSGIIISNYSIHDVPAKSYYFLRPMTTEANVKDDKSLGDDASKSDNNADWKSGTAVTVNSSSAATTLYMLENRRGVNSSITQQSDKSPENAPKRATYIDINGIVNGINVNWKVYLGADNISNFNIKRNCTYSITITINGIESIDARVVVEPKSINLSKEGVANCYLASASNQWYSFDATVRGNGETQDYVAEQYPGISLMPSKLPSSSNAIQIPKNLIKDAVVVWETSSGLISNIRWDRGSQHVKFETGTAIGNAVVAVRDASHTILWSWHIWRTNGVDLNNLNQSTSKHVMTISTNTDRQWYATLLNRSDIKRRRSITMLRCNIGAQLDDKCSYNTPEGNIGVYNMQYQFGRKDPFPGSATYERNDEETPIYGVGSSGTYTEFKIGDKAISSDVINGISTLDYIIQHPEHFIYNGIGTTHPLDNNSSWFHNATEGSPEVKINRCLWGDNNTETKIIVNSGGLDSDPWGTSKETGRKTIYDPCPAGWRVSAADSWTAIGKDNMGSSWISLPEAQCYHGSYDRGYTYFFGSLSGTSTFCPSTGTRSAVDAKVGQVEYLGTVWWSSPSVKHGTYFWSTPTAIHLASDMIMGYGLPVRCTKINP